MDVIAETENSAINLENKHAAQATLSQAGAEREEEMALHMHQEGASRLSLLEFPVLITCLLWVGDIGV